MPTPDSPSIYARRARVASLSRSRAVDDPDYVDARRDLAAANLEQYIERVVAEAPPLTAEQRDKLAAILRGAA
jgi:hypothetical protein